MYITVDIETTGLEALKDRVTAIAVKTPFKEKVFTSRNEKVILKQFWQYLRDEKFLYNPKIKLIGFNILFFDIPFLNIRSMKHRIKVINLKDRVIDLRLVLTYWNRYSRKGTLEQYSKLIGFTPKYNGFRGKQIPQLWKDKNFEALKEYVLQDVRMTYELYNAMKNIDLVY